MRKIIYLFCLILSVSTGAHAQIEYITTIYPQADWFTATDSLLFFNNYGSLYRSNGTPSGTYAIGTGGEFLQAVGNKVFFIRGNKVCVTDGTAAGTQELATFTEISPTNCAFGNYFYFTASTPAYGRELWRSDGTPAGTVIVKDIMPGIGNGVDNNIQLESAGNYLYFTAADSFGKEVWRSDGTTAGTQMVKDIVSGTGGSNPYFYTKVGNEMYFNTNLPTQSLWKTDGTTAGTQVVIPLSTRMNSLGINGILYFMTHRVSDGARYLWKSDGTAGGTVIIKDISAYQLGFMLYDVNGTLFYTAAYPTNNVTELWKSDGTTAGTVKIDSAAYFGARIAIKNQKLYYTTNGMYVTDNDFWEYNAVTGQKTKIVDSDIRYSGAQKPTVVGDKVFFTSPQGGTLWSFNTNSFDISSFTLVNSDTESDIRKLSNGDTIYSDQHVNIRANIYGTPGSIRFYVNGISERLENGAPFTVAGDSGGNYYQWTLPSGSIQLSARPYELTGASGIAGKLSTLNLTILAPEDTVTDINFVLINAETDLAIGPLRNGTIINIAHLPTNKLNIQAISKLPNTQSVVFDYNGTLNYRKENVAPYALFMDNNGDYNEWTANPGSYTVKATPYTGHNGLGAAGKGKTIHFTITNGGFKIASEIYPMPAEETIFVSIPEQVTGNASIVIADLSGREYFSGVVQIDGGKFSLNLSDMNMSEGVYLLKLSNETFTESLKIFKK